MTDAKHPGGRPRSGSLYWTKSGWRARITVHVDGVSLQKSFDLETTDKRVARIKMKRIAEANVAPAAQEAKAQITIAEFSKTWIERREAQGIAAVEYERRFMTSVWIPTLGRLPFPEVNASMVQEVLDDAGIGKIMPKQRKGRKDAPKPFSRQSIAHMRATLVRLFESAKKLGLIEVNRAALAEVPELQEVERPRAVLIDVEVAQLLAHRDVDAEIKLLVLLSRTIGGLRAGDLNALDWTAFSPGFGTCTFVRRKTRKKKPAPQVFIVPERVRPFIEVWWQNQRCPEAGPVFPVRRGPRAGQSKARTSMSYADRLRRALLVAGVRRHELHHPTPTTQPVDFHSTRRAYATALARVGANEQTAMALTGHSDSKVHQRYLQGLERAVPEAAIPSFSIDYAETLRRASGDSLESSDFSGAGHRVRTDDLKLGKLVLYQLS